LKGLKLFIISVFLLLSFYSFSQSYNFNHFGIDDGISQGAIRTISKSSDGFIWFGTQDGLNRFDGNSFKVYKHSKKNPKSISGNYINSLLDTKDRIWVGTIDNGVCYYDKNIDVFNAVGKRNRDCIKITKDDKNIFALFRNDGVSAFKIINDTIVENKIVVALNDNDKISTIFVNNSNILYLGTKLGELYYSKSKRNIDFFKIISLNSGMKEINVILENKSYLFIGTNNGMYIYDLKRNIINEIILDREFEKENELVVNDIEIVKDKFYIASDNGLYIAGELDLFDKSFSVIKNLKGDKNDVYSITSNRVYDLLKDEDILWIGTNKLDVMYIEEPVFKLYSMSSKIKLSNDFIFSIYKTDNYTFIGTRHGLNCIDNKGKVTQITKENSKLAYNVIRGLNKDIYNNLWIATTKGLSIMKLSNFDPKTPDIQSIYANIADTNTLGNNNTRSIFIDNKNRVWISTFGGGIYLFTGDISKKSFKFKQFKHIERKNSLSSDFTYNFSQDITGKYWIATRNGLNVLDFRDEDKPIFRVYNKENKSFESNSILCTYQDSSIVWIGSHSGMYKFDLSNNKITAYNESKGLTNDVVYSILEDKSNHLWLSTNAGLFSFDKKTEVFTNFNKIDGLQSSEFNLGALFNDGDILYFGGINGVNYFNPKDIDRLYNESKLTFTSLVVKGAEINPYYNNKTLGQNITRAKRIKLNYDDFPSYISFSDLNFNKEINSEFVYKLVPNDGKWNDLKGRKEIQLLNLPAGSYKLQVQGKSNNKFWDKKPLEIDIEVVSAWYKSNWAYLIYSLLIASVIFFIYRFQMEKKLNKRELFRLQEVAKKNIIINKALAEKEVLFKEIHHRVKNNLQVVSSILSLQERYLKNPKAIAAIRDSQSRIQAISLIHQKLYTDESIVAIRIKDYIDDLANGIINSMEMDEEKVKYYSEIENLLLEVDTVTPIGLILNEVIINSIKHNSDIEKLNIEIKLFKKNESIVLSVKDNGKGVDENFDYKKTDSYGMKLIESLSKKLKANIEFINENGLVVKLVIRKFKEVS